MSAIEKSKNLFIINLDGNRKCYFNFEDGQIYGISGKVVKNFSSEARKVLADEASNNFIAYYFATRTNSWARYEPQRWSFSMVETLYSLFGNQYSVDVLGTIAQYCCNNCYTLNKKGVRALTLALKNLEDEKGEFDYLNYEDFNVAMTLAINEDLPQNVAKLFVKVKEKDIKDIIKKDAKKISFYCEHESWTCLMGPEFAADSLSHYIRLCDVLGHERTYKNMFVCLSKMNKEKELLADKVCANYQKEAPLFFEDENFIVLIPTTAEEFKAEAHYQHNCVFNVYYPDVRDLRTHVVFIRKKDDVNTPFITCEVTNKGKIKQYLARFNEKVKDEKAVEFRHKYQQFLSEHF